MKIALLNDTHCGSRNSSNILLDNAETFYEKVFFPYCIEHDIKHIIHLGDYYDNRKFINFKSLNRNRHHFLNKLRLHNMTMDIIVGNHDVYYKNTNNLNSLKELLGHYMDVVTIIHKPTTMKYDEFEIALVPWINSENEEESMNFIRDTPARYMGGHFDIIGYEMAKGVESIHGMDSSVFDRFDSVYSGHFHTKSSKNNIHYLGSQMEFFWNDAHDKKYFHVFDTSTVAGKCMVKLCRLSIIFKELLENTGELMVNRNSTFPNAPISPCSLVLCLVLWCVVCAENNFACIELFQCCLQQVGALNNLASVIADQMLIN